MVQFIVRQLLSWPSLEQIENTFNAFAKLGIKVNITELDIDVLPQAWHLQNTNLNAEALASLNPYSKGLPDSIDQALAHRYAELFQIYRKYSYLIDRVTFWGLTDQESWLNCIPIKGRTNYPLLFDRYRKPKLAFHKIVTY